MTTINVPILREFLARRTGLDLGRGGMEARLVSYIRHRLIIGELSFERYLEQIEIPGSEELSLLTETMTVVYTWFFRDPGQFRVIEQLIRSFTSDRAMGIWVAGCATGEESYSVALVAAELGRRADILGTDVNASALRHAKAGRYVSASLDAVDAAMRVRYLDQSSGDYRVPETVKASVRFQAGNLVEAAPRAQASEGWDLVICRNVLIYFGQEQARRTLNTLAGSLAPGGTLILGASEAILERPTSLQVAGVAGRAVLVRPRPEDAKLALSQPSAERVPYDPRQNMDSLVQPNSPPYRMAANAKRMGVATHESSTQLAPNNHAVAHPAAHSITSPGVTKPTTVRSSLEYGHAALDSGNVPVARENYLRAVSMDPTCAEALMFAGIAYYLDGDFAQALVHLRGALFLDGTLWTAFFFQALCYDSMGYAEDAVLSYSQVVRLAGGSSRRTVEYPFLKGWRHDLLDVATKRARPGISPRSIDSPLRRRVSGST